MNYILFLVIFHLLTAKCTAYEAIQVGGMSAERGKKVEDKPWLRLEQALKATDLLLQTGGFGAIVLDMSDLVPQHAGRIPLATWYRFRLAAEQARTSLIFLTQSPCTGKDLLSGEGISTWVKVTIAVIVLASVLVMPDDNGTVLTIAFLSLWLGRPWR